MPIDCKNGRILRLGLCLRTSESPEAHVRADDCSASLERRFLDLREELYWETFCTLKQNWLPLNHACVALHGF